MLCCPVWWWALPLIQRNNDESLPIINKSKHPNKGGIQRTKKEGPQTSKKRKEPSKEANHQGTSSSSCTPSCPKKRIE
jgi:hypothetical protein